MSSQDTMEALKKMCSGIPSTLPEVDRKRDPSVPHAPTRNIDNILSKDDQILAVKNALRYFDVSHHKVLAKEFHDELREYGHIYMYRFRPQIDMKAYPLELYPFASKQAGSMIVMIMNNLDPAVAQYPHELVTYGGNGSVFSNWAQFLLTVHYLSIMTDEQTLSMYSGHPMGLFPSHKEAPRCVITNGLVVPNYSSRNDYERLYALGCTIYGQMTAGSYCYIGPQGIVHGTTLTVLNAGRKYLNLEDLSGKVFVTSGLGGMSGAQPKAGVITGCITVVAEIDWSALDKRHKQGWVMEVSKTLDELVDRVKQARKDKRATSIAYHGNIVDLWERLAREDELLVELGSDQTSLHNPFNGGYYPVGYAFEESKLMMKDRPDEFKTAVQESLRRQVEAIKKLTSRGMKFWDYGNSFLLEASRAGADVIKNKETQEFIYPSYVQDIMGDIFSLGFGPFRWVCLSGLASDLSETDRISQRVITDLMKNCNNDKVNQQYKDNELWITQAESHKLVVGSQARILYSDIKGRVEIAVAMNKAIADGTVKGPIALSRDHHDVSGADSPFRETSNVYDGSFKTSDMATQTMVGNGFRGATWIALHNGGGTGWGEAINCGFGLVLDGSPEAEHRARQMLFWDVSNGVARRAWSGNENAQDTIGAAMQMNPLLKVTVGQVVDENLLKSL
ncbi:urocanate hydratase [Acrasis kona]|uniref:urocanate hydratase n=1 Tax=Acrasis kona TaxID=1008807 RepID=A0AAW2Z2E8_9EUKA